jgi:peptide/nickel transport system substrate-binding protein
MTIADRVAQAGATPMNRRDVLKRSVAFGLGVSTFGALLTACGEDDDAVDADTGVAEPDDADEDAGVDDEPDEPAVDPEEDADDPETDEDPEITDDVDEEGDDESLDEDDRMGGAINIGTIGEPPTLDIHQTTADIVALITWHIYEPLFTWDEDFELMGDLAESHEVSDDGLNISIGIRDGVTFHNGEQLTAEDVRASFDRWANLSPLAGDILDVTDDVETVDDQTIEFHLNRAFGAFAVLMSRQSQGFAIYPASVIEESTEAGLADYIGSGPYQFVEHVSDQHIHLERFDDYAQPPDEPSGYGGYKPQYLDDIYFQPVPDEASRVAGLQAGDFHYVLNISSDQFDVLDEDPDITAETLPAQSWAMFVLNTAEGLMSDQTIRQAVQAALDHEEMAQAAYGEGFYDLHPGLMHRETAWYSEVGGELYNQNDPDRAAELLEEADYDGTPIRFVTTQEYGYMYNSAVVGVQQLEDAGFEVDLQVYDWATVVEIRANPEEWDIFTTGSSFRVDPVMQPYIASTDWPGWWDSEEKVAAAEELMSETDFDVRFAAFEEVQRLWYEEAPKIKIADGLSFNARRSSVQGFSGQVQLGDTFWNLWIED